ncbi:hypothetical protein IAQ61_004736 [Plenodomus lingam]|uniref:uncharacterized protein n=1 Tax=Leptosphaeria maculans TaxID=5022 RepID=UPI00332AB61E|nr:hypothetical protein IAQ61_004736 [Plenodomus lingam]
MHRDGAAFLEDFVEARELGSDKLWGVVCACLVAHLPRLKGGNEAFQCATSRYLAVDSEVPVLQNIWGTRERPRVLLPRAESSTHRPPVLYSTLWDYPQQDPHALC